VGFISDSSVLGPATRGVLMLPRAGICTSVQSGEREVVQIR
jgi:hypothetical protein